MVYWLAFSKKSISLTCAISEIEIEDNVVRPKVAMSPIPLGTVSGCQLSAESQSLPGGASFQAALPAHKFWVRKQQRKPIQKAKKGRE
ncbi:MAG TPA: hypothetical protein VGI85_01115 [Chthoniobacterales bacterium]|jgi:hypothetical protein